MQENPAASVDGTVTVTADDAVQRTTLLLSLSDKVIDVLELSVITSDGCGPRGMEKSNIAAPLVPELVTLALVPASPVDTDPTEMVAAVPVVPVAPVCPVGITRFSV
jgi:hypothetical protein